MNYIRHLNAIFEKIKKDDRLGAVHISLYLALFQYWNFNRFQNPFPVYRHNIMELSKLGSKNTYHKSLKQLHHTGYIIFHPAPSRYLPSKISMVRLDTRQSAEGNDQLPLFPQAPRTQYSGDHLAECSQVPNRAPAESAALCPKNETQQVSKMGHIHVPKMGHYIKPIKTIENSVYHTPTKNCRR